MTVPKLRFKEFGGGWTEVTLENLAEVERGKFSIRPRNDPRYFGGAMPFVQTGDVTGSDIYLRGYSQTLNDDGIRVSKVFPADTILITIAANIGDTTITQYPIACPDSVVAIQPKKNVSNTIFLKNIIDLQKDYLDSQATQNAQKNINLQVLKPLELIVPNLEEQTKIASFLSAVDEKISQLNQKHRLLCDYKQGMMQKLFSQQLRFKADDGSEFGEWEETTLKNCITSIDSGWSPQCESYSTNLNEWGVLKTTSVDWNGFNAYFNKKLPDKLTPRPELEVQPLDILVTRAGPTDRVGVVAVVPEEVRSKLMISDKLIRLKANEKSNPIFLGISLSLVKCQNQLQSKTSGLAKSQTNISQKILNDVLLTLPSKEEQTKIANFLSAINQKIEVVAQQIEQAKVWKKGLLQQMFV